MDKLDVKNKKNKKVQIEFENPVSCAIDVESSFLSECFHKNEYPPRMKECIGCLVANKHRQVSLDEYGRPFKFLERKDGQWKDKDLKPFNVLTIKTI